VIAAVLNEHRGSIVPVVIPTSTGRSPVRLKIGQPVIVLATATDRRRVVPIRFATAADVEPGQKLTTLLLELEGRPTTTTLDLVQAFVEARSIRPERGRLHVDGPPLLAADESEDAWLAAVTKLTELDPDAYRDIAFLEVDDRRPGVLRLVAAALDPSHLSALRVAFVDRDGAEISEVPGGSTISLPDAPATRVDVRHRSVSGTLTLPEPVAGRSWRVLAAGSGG
jgi:hypothetical protein